MSYDGSRRPRREAQANPSRQMRNGQPQADKQIGTRWFEDETRRERAGKHSPAGQQPPGKHQRDGHQRGMAGGAQRGDQFARQPQRVNPIDRPHPQHGVADEGREQHRNRGPRHGCGTVFVNLTIFSTVSSS